MVHHIGMRTFQCWPSRRCRPASIRAFYHQQVTRHMCCQRLHMGLSSPAVPFPSATIDQLCVRWTGASSRIYYAWYDETPTRPAPGCARPSTLVEQFEIRQARHPGPASPPTWSQRSRAGSRTCSTTSARLLVPGTPRSPGHRVSPTRSRRRRPNAANFLVAPARELRC